MKLLRKSAVLGLCIGLALQACGGEPTPHWASGTFNRLVVTASAPPDGSDSAGVATVVSARLSRILDPASVTANSLTLTLNGDPVAGSVALSEDGRTVTFTPAAPLERMASYTATLSGVVSLDDLSLESPMRWSFATAGGAWSAPRLVALQERVGVNTAAPESAVDAQGNTFAVWDMWGATNTKAKVWANRYTPSDGWGMAEIVQSAPGLGRTAKVVAAPDGSALVVWAQTDGDQVPSAIWANRFTPSGGWGTAEPIEPDFTTNGREPDLAIDSQGRAVAVWEQETTGRGIWASWYIPSEGWSSPQPIASGAGRNLDPPRVAIAEGQVAVAIWDQSDALPDSQSIWASRYTSSGGWGTPEAIEGDDPGPFNGFNAFEVAMDPAGTAIAVWERLEPIEGEPNRFNAQIWTNRSAPSGEWGTVARLETRDESALDPRVVMDANGNAIAVWIQSDGTRSRLVSKRYTPSVGWGEEALAENTSSGIPRNPDLAIDGLGNALLAWEHGPFEGDTSVWTNRYTPAGGWGNGESLEAGEDSPAKNPSVSIGAGGDAAIVWTHVNGNDDDDVGIWASQLE